MENKLNAILLEIKTSLVFILLPPDPDGCMFPISFISDLGLVVIDVLLLSKSTSMTTNPRSEINKIGNMQPSGSGGKRSMRVNASDNESLDSENEDIPLKASDKRELRHPAKPIHQNDTTLDATLIFNEESDEEDYHNFNGLLFPCCHQFYQATSNNHQSFGGNFKP